MLDVRMYGRINEMKSNMIRERSTHIDLITFGDWHLGARECNLPRIKQMIEWIKDNKNARVILMGDLLDDGLRDSVGAGSFDNDMTPEEQYELALELLLPIKSKIYGLHTGNHEERIRDRTSLNISKMLARELDVSYLEYSCVHRIHIKNVSYILFTTHGASGSTKPHTKMAALRQFSSYIDADCFCMGHVHELDTSADVKLKLNIGNKQVEEHKRYYVLTGHYLKYGGYALKKAYIPGKSGSPKIRLDGKKKDIHVYI